MRVAKIRDYKAYGDEIVIHGQGIMGSPMVRNLLKRGHAVTVWARRREAIAPLATAGASAGESPADVAARSDIIMTMVTDTKAVEDVVLGEHGIARALVRGLWLSITARSRRTERGGLRPRY